MASTSGTKTTMNNYKSQTPNPKAQVGVAKMADFVKVAKLNEVPEGHAKIFEVGDERVALCRVAGKVFAIADVCTHDGGPLGEGDLEGYEIICPRHGARFDVRTGAVLAFPAIKPVASYPVKIDGDDVYVQIED